jgi:NAD(P)-dependent dehydrogenase (short-subunit alcohol dehydrogenase family)
MEADTKVVFITGATKNTGYAIAEKFACEKYNVCISSRDQESAAIAAEKLGKNYPEIKTVGYKMDPADPREIATVFDKINSEFGRLDSLIANAANLGVGLNILNTLPEEYDAVMDANAKGYFFCSQAAARIMMKQGGGSIVLIGSVHAHGAVPGRVVYAASKGAVSSMCRCIAVELSKYNIRCNSLNAGAIWSERWEKQSAAETAERRARWPLGKESSPQDIAKAVYFLASDQSPTVTGTELVVDSGISICLLPYDDRWDSK